MSQLLRGEIPECLQNPPKDLSKITVEQFEAWARYLAKNRTLRKLRQWQGIQRQQIQWAFERKNTLVLVNCQIMLNVGSAAVAIKTWKDDSWEAHIPDVIR